MKNTQTLEKAFGKFFEIIKTLRSENGCPWDKDQTPLSLRSTFFEETCEAIDAITEKDDEHTKEELGDVLLNTIIIAYMFEQKNIFAVEDVVTEISKKLVRRHPHVFEQSEGKSQMTENQSNAAPEKILEQWDKIKENVEGRKEKSILDQVPENFPPILKSYKMLKKASKKNFEWNSLSQVFEKFKEELKEIEEAKTVVENAKTFADEKSMTVSSSNKTLDDAQLHLEEEFGDALLAFINYGRWLNIDPNVALQKANKKFYNRFSFVESKMQENNIPMDKNHQNEMNTFWQEAKSKGL